MDDSLNFPIGLDFKSVLIYLLFFSISFFFCYISERNFENKKWIGILSAMMSIMILCLLSALRSINVGGDINVYLLPNFKQAMLCNTFTEFYSIAIRTELLFSLLVYIFSKINSLALLFFVIQLLILLPVYFVLYKNRKRCSMTTSYIVYIFLFYNFSLSGMRQSIATSLMYLAIDYLMNKKYLKFILWAILAFLFHKGVIIPLSLIMLILFFENKKIYKYFLIISVNGMIIFFIFYNQFIDLLDKVFLFINPRYSYYIHIYLNDNIQWDDIPTTEIVLKNSIVLCCILFGYYRNKVNIRNISILVFTLIGRYFVLLNARMYEALRVAYYFDIFCITLVGNTVYQLNKKLDRKVISFCLITPAFLYWIYFIMYIGGYKTNIYTFI